MLLWSYRSAGVVTTGLRWALGRVYWGDSTGRLYSVRDSLATGCDVQGEGAGAGWAGGWMDGCGCSCVGKQGPTDGCVGRGEGKVCCATPSCV